MRSNTLPTGSVRCSTIQSLPGQDNRYTYRVMFLPGRQFFPAGTIHISRPSTPSITCTPAGLVTENSMLTCTCTTDKVGQPEGRLRWLRGSSDVIAIGAPGVDRLELRQTLSRSDDGDQFRCRLDWSDEPVTSTMYTASVGYPPSTSALTINPSTTSGSVSVSENTTVVFNCCASCGTAEAQAQIERGDVTSYLVFHCCCGLGCCLGAVGDDQWCRCHLAMETTNERSVDRKNLIKVYDQFPCGQRAKCNASRDCLHRRIQQSGDVGSWLTFDLLRTYWQQ
ncbi:uncharacterized protein [Littorina saxatilis]|uniref:uncharacterized protein isoform X1 n=1 Tax=Littorina saxatilis TaxID=31220 RepID=UPI0038B5CBC4